VQPQMRYRYWTIRHIVCCVLRCARCGDVKDEEQIFGKYEKYQHLLGNDSQLELANQQDQGYYSGMGITNECE